MLAALVGRLLDHVRGCYRALTRGGADALAAFLGDDAVHHHKLLAPPRGRRDLLAFDRAARRHTVVR